MSDQVTAITRLPVAMFHALTVAHAEVARLQLTDAEREDLAMWLAECLRQHSAATDGGDEELAERWQGRATRAAAMMERLGGGR